MGLDSAVLFCPLAWPSKDTSLFFHGCQSLDKNNSAPCYCMSPRVPRHWCPALFSLLLKYQFLKLQILKLSVSPRPTKMAQVCPVHEDWLTYSNHLRNTCRRTHPQAALPNSTMLCSTPALQRRMGWIKPWVERSPFTHTSAFFSGRMRPFSVRHVKAGGFWRLSISSETQEKA